MFEIKFSLLSNYKRAYFPRSVSDSNSDSLTTFRCFLKQEELEDLKPQLGLVYVSVRHLCFDAHSQDLTVINKPPV